MRQVRLAVFEVPYEEGPLASVRYTRYGNDEVAEAVKQVDYWEEDAMDTEVYFALKNGIDATVYTSHNMDLFPNISRVAQ